MATVALTEDYHGPVLDKEENFHGNRVIYVHWEEHLMFCAALAFPFPPGMPLGAVFNDVLPQFYGLHPDWKDIDWSEARFELDGQPFTPDMSKSLDEQGFHHKSLLRFWTPGLNGWKGTAS